MWLFEITLLVAFFVVGVWMPTDNSDDYAVKHGFQAENQQKRATIERAKTEYEKQYPWSAPLYKSSILAIGVGFTLVMIVSVHAQGEALDESENVGVLIGYIIQVLAFASFALCSLTKRHALVNALHKAKKDQRPNRGD